MTELNQKQGDEEITYEMLFEKLGKMKVKKEINFDEIWEQQNKSAVFPNK